jgi:hypothetical protein
MKTDPRKFVELPFRGYEVLITNAFRVGIIFILVLLFQYISIKYKTIAYSIVSKILLCFTFLTVPYALSNSFKYLWISPFYFYAIGLYLAVAAIILSIICDIFINRKEYKIATE